MLSRRLDLAREGFRKKDLSKTKKAHTKSAIHLQFEKGHQVSEGQYIGDYVYGALDGIITTFAVVSGVAGAHLSSAIIIILGMANLLGDGFSMAIGNYLSTKAELEYIKKEREREEWEIDHYPEGEIEEIRQIYKKKGFKGKDLERAVKIVTSNKKTWLDTMMFEELGLVEDSKNPLKSAFATFISFIIAGFVPLLSFVLALFVPFFKTSAFSISIVLTGLALFVTGSLKMNITGVPWYKGGTEMLVVGSLAAAVAYLVGFLLQGLA